jgi:hypothetical protein
VLNLFQNFPQFLAKKNSGKNIKIMKNYSQFIFIFCTLTKFCTKENVADNWLLHLGLLYIMSWGQ